jgi:hypothetical protein
MGFSRYSTAVSVYMLAFVISLFAMTPSLLAEDTCPVINRATAGGMLAAKSNSVGVAEAQLAIEWHTPTDYICTFTSGANTLKVTVAPYHARDGWPSYTKQCFAKPEPLQAIGNEAVACYGSDNASPLQGEVISHVRDVYLDVRLTLGTPPAPDSARAAAVLREYTRRAAEIVSGNLF